jgi:hypothetical protein
MANDSYEAVLKVNPSVILKFQASGTLRNLVLLVMKGLYQKRRFSTSTLHEIPKVGYEVNLTTKYTSTKTHELKEIEFTRMERAVEEALQSPDKWFPVSVFLQLQEESVTDMSKKTKISHYCLRNARETGRKYLYTAVKQNKP